MYDLQMDNMNQHPEDGLADDLTSQLWETYGPVPMRLLYMGSWLRQTALSSSPICDDYLNVTCAHPTCKMRSY